MTLRDERSCIGRAQLPHESLFDEWRVHDTDHDGIAAYTFLHVLHCRGLRERDEAGFRRAVSDVDASRNVLAQSGNGRDVDDGAGLLALHDWKDVFAAEERALQIEVDLRVPNFFAHRNRIAGSRAADVVHEYID